MGEGDRKRQVRPDILIGALLGAAVCIGLPVLVIRAMPRVVESLREFDGARPLINGYELWLLHNDARTIMLGNSSGPTTTPSNFTAQTHEIGRYAIADEVIVGELEAFWGAASPPPATRYFVLDTAVHRLDEYDGEGEWRSALKERGIEFGALAWRY